MVLDWKSGQEYSVNAGDPQSAILGPTLFLLYINDLPDDVINDSAIYTDDTTVYSNCDKASVFKLESDLPDTVHWGKKWLIDFNARKTQLVLFDRSNNTGSTKYESGWVCS